MTSSQTESAGHPDSSWSLCLWFTPWYHCAHS